MSLKTVCFVALIGLSADLFADIRSDIAAGRPMLEVVAAAKEAGLTPADTVSALMSAGQSPQRAAYGVAHAWDDCNATSEAVYTATQADPQAAPSVVLTVGGISNCGCSAETMWARTRLSTRIRPDTFQRPIEITAACSCLSTAVEAASRGAPSQIDRIVQAASESGQQMTSPIADSVGDRSHAPDGPLGSINSPSGGSIQAFQRKPTICEGDSDDADEFDVADEWLRIQVGDFSGLGTHSMRCEDGSEEAEGLLISEYQADPGGGSYVELYNPSDEEIDLMSQYYKLSVAYEGVGHIGETVSLRGKIKPGQTFLVASADAPPVVAQRAQQLLPSLSVSAADSVSVHAGWQNADCGCSETIVASALRGGSGQSSSGTNLDDMSLTAVKIGRSYGQMDNVRPGFVVDSIGQVGGDSNTERALMPALQRDSNACEGDPNELDRFAVGNTWRFGTSSQANAYAGCSSRTDDVLIAEFVDTQNDRDVIKLHNPTLANIDLSSGYVVELYGTDNRTPSRIIQLDGMLNSGNSAMIANSNMDVSATGAMHLRVGQLELSETNAVVLRKVTTRNNLLCEDPVAGAITEPPGEIYFVQVPSRARKNPPIHVDPVASPN